MKQLLGSIALLNMRRNSRSSTSFLVPPTSLSTDSSVSSSPSLFASEKRSPESRRPESILSTVPTMPSSSARSLPRSWAFFGSSQTFGSSRAVVTSRRRDFFAS
jgi:hypothetical protein